MRVLIVEDGVGAQSLLVSELQARGHEVETCQSPLTAWSAHQEHPYVLLFIGLMAAPGKSLQLLRQLRVSEAARRSNTPRTTAIALIPAENLEVVEAGLQAGADDYLALPYDLLTLQLRLSVIERQTDRRLRERLSELTRSSQNTGRSSYPRSIRNAALRQFPYIASHHLRQTLVQVKKQLTELVQQPTTLVEREREAEVYLNSILDRASLMQQLISNLLLDTQPDTGSDITRGSVDAHQEYLILNADFTVRETSPGVERFAEPGAISITGNDVRQSFPELTGVESLLVSIMQGRERSFELSGIGRFMERDPALYFDLYITRYPANIDAAENLIVLLSDATERMVFQQRLIHSANEAQILLKRLMVTKDYIAQILAAMADALIVTDRAGTIKNVNRATQRLFGSDESEFLGKSLDRFVPESHQLRQLDEASQVEVTCQRCDGQAIVVAFSCGTIQTEEDLTEYVYVGRDITQRRQAESKIHQLNASLQQRTAELEALNSELESFSRTVSHDLRTPLSHAEFFNQMLREEYADRLDAEGQDYIEQVAHACQRMRHLIEDLLQLAQVTRSDLEMAEVNLSELTLTIAQSLQRQANGRRVEFAIADGITARGNARLLRVALENLLGNAWKYTSKRELARIEFNLCRARELAREDLPPDTLIYFLRDNGAGFDMNYADNLFSVFGRLHSQSEFEGTGIGLSTVQRIIQRHGGRIWAEAAVDRGATFYFTLSAT